MSRGHSLISSSQIVYIASHVVFINVFHPGSARGSVGVLSYDIDGTNHKVVISWDVPFDRNLFDVKFNMKVSSLFHLEI